MSTDALLDAPVPRAAKRSRRLDPVLRDAVAKEASSSTLTRTGAQVAKLMERVRRWNIRRISASLALRTIAPRMARYRTAVQEALKGEVAPILSVACDGTRMGKRDC
eukprot:7604328-Lingulodinium_polyedra.AAC.1